MSFLQILALDTKPISSLSMEDVLTNPKYADKAWKIWTKSTIFKEIDESLDYYRGRNTFIDAWKRKGLFAGGTSLNKSEGLINHEELYKDELKIKNPFFADLINQLSELLLSNQFKISADEDKDLETWLEKNRSKNKFNQIIKLQFKEHMIKAFTGMNFQMEDNEISIEPIPAEKFAFFYENYSAKEPSYIIINKTMEQQYLKNQNGTESFATAKQKSYIVISKVGIVEHTYNNETKEWISIDKTFYNTTTQNISEQEKILLAQEKVNTPLLPFAIMTTETLESLLKPLKSIIDAYDINSTDSINELIRLIKTLWVVKGSEGSSNAELMNLINAGILNMQEDADAKKLEGSEATSQRKMKEEELKESFYRFSKAIDMEKMKSLSNTSGVSIKAMYEPLLQKANDLEISLREYILDIYKRLYMLENNIETKKELDEAFQNVKIEFNKHMITNENEDLTSNALQIGKVDELTRLKNHPWMKNKTKDELKEVIQEINGDIIEDPMLQE